MAKRPLDRILRVRTLQVGLAQAEEARARDRLQSETALAHRIAELANQVAPATSTAHALSISAAASLRERLNHSADAARDRLRAAEYQARLAAEATQAARRDQSAVEKLMARADAEAALAAIRKLEEAPPVRKVRHDPC